MASVNKVILVGRLGADPESRSLQGDKRITKFRMATDFGFGDKRSTDWHKVTTFDKVADNCAKYLSKGSSVYVEGRIQYRKWEKDDGTTQWLTEVVAHTVQFLDSRQESAPSRQRQAPPRQDKPPAFDDGFSDDDIPF